MLVHLIVFLEPVNPIISFKRRGLGSQSDGGTTVEQVQHAMPLSLYFSASITRHVHCPALFITFDRTDFMFFSFAPFRIPGFQNTRKNQNPEKNFRIHQARAFVISLPAAPATMEEKHTASLRKMAQ